MKWVKIIWFLICVLVFTTISEGQSVQAAALKGGFPLNRSDSAMLNYNALREPELASGHLAWQNVGSFKALHKGLSFSLFQDDPTPTETPVDPTPTATNTPEPTPTLTPTPTVPSLGLRPVVVLASYSTKPALISPGSDFNLEIRLMNQGKVSARNIILTIAAGNFIPRQTGGVLALDELSPGGKHKLIQPLSASSSLAGTTITTLDVKVSYTDDQGLAYSEAFTIALNLTQPVYGGPAATPTPTPTPTPIAINRPQLVISGYQADTTPLQPGNRFTLTLSVFNVGNVEAKRVTMIVGGASLTTNPEGSENDPQKPGGFTAAGGEFTNFSPLGASNVQSLGNLAAGEALTAQQSLIVNVTTNPGVYSLKISFAYLDDKGNLLIDDQVISLLVYSPPVVEINFYRDPGLIYAGQPNQLPVQIVNLGRKSAVFGTLTLNAPNGQLMNHSIFVGPLEMGGYFPMDATWIPDFPGQVEVAVSVDYTDDFNQPQKITRVLVLEVLEMPVTEPIYEPGTGPGENPGVYPPEVQPETFWQKVLRFISGLFGLDSALPSQNIAGDIPPGEGNLTGVGTIVTGPPLKGP
jgi:hypothetical protein